MIRFLSKIVKKEVDFAYGEKSARLWREITSKITEFWKKNLKQFVFCLFIANKYRVCVTIS